jgi:hypothetical protein
MRSMKKLFIFGAWMLAAVVSRAALPQPDLIAQIHFAGAQQISHGKDFSAFTNEFASDEAHALASQTFDKLSRAPGAWLKNKLAAGATDGAAQLRPLLDDLLVSEWFFEARDTASGSPEYVLAVRLSNERAELWSKNLASVLSGWTGIGITQGKPGAWSLKKHEAPNLFQFSRVGDWVLIDCGQNSLSLVEKVIGSIKSQTMGTNWLAADLNWPRLAQLVPGFKGWDLPEAKFTVSAAAENLHINGKLLLPENFTGALPNWQIPTNTIHQPFVSFTAARGLGAWLNAQPWAKTYEIAPAPNQFFIWGLANVPYQTFMATPVANAAGALAQSYAHLSPVFNSPVVVGNFFSHIKLEKTNDIIRFTGIPFISAYLQAVTEKNGQFLLAGAFPNTPRSKPLPPELFTRLAQKNLAYYHWEITAERFPQLLNLTQLGMVLSDRQQLAANSVALKWMQKTTPALGNTITEVFQTGPDELTFNRLAPGGLTAFELIALGHWLEAKNFPGCDLKLPPRPNFNNRRLHPPGAMRVPTSPAVPVAH